MAPFRALRPPVPSHATAEAPGGSDHKAFLPLGAAMLLASAGSFAQTPPAPAATGVQLPTVTVKESAEIQNKDTLKPTTTTIGKGKQALRDIPQSVTVFTERLMNDRNQDDFRDVLRSTAGVTFQAGETGEEDIRLRGFSLGQAGDIYIDGMKDAPLYERDTFNNDSVEVLKGSASMLFGKGSTGGVVNQVNKMPLLMDQHEASYTLGTGQQHRLTGDFNFLTGENAAFRINALVHDEKNFGAKQRKLGIAPTYSWGVGTRDEFSVGLYALDIQGRPLYDHPWFLDGQRIVPSLPARNYYGLASDKLDSSAQYVTLAHTHRFDNNGELQTRLRHGRYERDLLASAVRFAAGTTRDNLNGDTVVTRSAKGRLGISELTQLQSDYTNTFAWGGRKHAVIAGVDLYYDDARRDQRYTGTGTMPNTTVGTPNDGAVRPTPRGAPTFNTFDASNLGLYAQDTVSITDTVKLARTACGARGWVSSTSQTHRVPITPRTAARTTLRATPTSSARSATTPNACRTRRRKRAATSRSAASSTCSTSARCSASPPSTARNTTSATPTRTPPPRRNCSRASATLPAWRSTWPDASRPSGRCSSTTPGSPAPGSTRATWCRQPAVAARRSRATGPA